MNNLQDLIQWFVSDVKFKVTEEEINLLLSFYSEAKNDNIVDDFAFMHESESNFKTKIKEIKNKNIDNLINWFIEDTKGKINIKEEEINILSNYYKNNNHITPDKMINDFAIIHKSEQELKKHIDKISNEIIDVIDLKDENNKKFVKIIYGDGRKKIFENTLNENCNFIFNNLIQKKEDQTEYFNNIIKDKEEIKEEQSSKLVADTQDGSMGLSNQKRLGTHPAGGSRFSWIEEGFMNTLFFIFLTGIGTGIVIMVFLNLLSK